MLERFHCGYFFRNFSKSSTWRTLEKVKPPESPSSQSTQTEANSSVFDSMSVVPTEFDKRMLLLSGKYKSREEIPPRVRYETMDYAKSKVRIKLANILMATTVIACLSVIYIGKKRQKEGDSLLKRMTDRENVLREEGRLRRERSE